jgi:hypothetical protein
MRSTVDFHRFSAIMKRTLLLKRLNNHQTQLNQMYWAHYPIASCASFIARKRPRKSPKKAFFASGSDASRLAKDMTSYKNHLDDFSNWTRLNALMAAVSFFEIYFKSVISLALTSDPGVIKGKSKILDGILLFKIGIHDDFNDEIKDCIIGDWNKRNSTFKRMFGESPQILENNIGTLEAIRELRNGVGHAFGREPSAYEEKIGLVDPPMNRLSHETLIEYLKLLDRVSKEVDKQLLDKNIGNFELLRLFHEWREDFQSLSEEEIVKSFNLYLKHQNIASTNKDFCAGLIHYYNQI